MNFEINLDNWIIFEKIKSSTSIWEEYLAHVLIYYEMNKKEPREKITRQ